MATAIQFLRSAAPRLRPNPVDLASGMPMINMAPEEPGLYFRLTDDTLVKIGPTFIGSVPPNDGPVGEPGNVIGEAWLDVSDEANPILKFWDGTKWVEVGSSGQVQSDWNITDDSDPSFIHNKPVIADANWDADINEDGYIENKPDVYIKNSYIQLLPDLP